MVKMKKGSNKFVNEIKKKKIKLIKKNNVK